MIVYRIQQPRPILLGVVVQDPIRIMSIMAQGRTMLLLTLATIIHRTILSDMLLETNRHEHVLQISGPVSIIPLLLLEAIHTKDLGDIIEMHLSPKGASLKTFNHQYPFLGMHSCILLKI